MHIGVRPVSVRSRIRVLEQQLGSDLDLQSYVYVHTGQMRIQHQQQAWLCKIDKLTQFRYLRYPHQSLPLRDLQIRALSITLCPHLSPRPLSPAHLTHLSVVGLQKLTTYPTPPRLPALLWTATWSLPAHFAPSLGVLHGCAKKL
jgi:hypothetical protein